jgi:hypothetical protein
MPNKIQAAPRTGSDKQNFRNIRFAQGGKFLPRASSAKADDISNIPFQF